MNCPVACNIFHIVKVTAWQQEARLVYSESFQIASSAPERCFKNRCWLGKEQSPLKTSTSIKQPCVAQCMSAHATQTPTEQSRGDGQ